MAFYLSIRSLGLGQAVTLYFLSPILVALAAKPFLRERTPWPQWAAILLGFVGVALASGISIFEDDRSRPRVGVLLGGLAF
jgi:drug/metabolite transporter (DMT)-like permease